MTMTVRDAIFLALRGNPDIQSEELDRVSQKYALVVAKNEFEPQYSLTGSLNHTSSTAGGDTSRTTTSELSPAIGIKNHYGTEFTLTSKNPTTNGIYNPAITLAILQPLIRGFGKTIVEAALKNAFNTETINKLNMKSNIIATVATIIGDYLTLAQTKATLYSDQKSLKRLNLTIEQNEAQYKAGKLAKFNLVQAEAKAATQKAFIQNDVNAISTARYRLLSDLGLNPNTKIDIPNKMDYDTIHHTMTGPGQLPSAAKSKRLALANNPSYQTEGFMLKILGRNLMLAKNEGCWQLDLTASGTTGGGTGTAPNSGLDSLVNGKNHEEVVGLNLSIPIDDVNIKQDIINAQVALDKQKIEYHKQKRDLIIAVIDKRNTVISNRKQLGIDLQALKLNRQNVHYAELRKKAGRISTFELLNNQDDLTVAQQLVITDTINYLNAVKEFNKMLGLTLDRWNITIKY